MSSEVLSNGKGKRVRSVWAASYHESSPAGGTSELILRGLDKGILVYDSIGFICLLFICAAIAGVKKLLCGSLLSRMQYVIAFFAEPFRARQESVRVMSRRCTL
jgi:hypothetical protein